MNALVEEDYELARGLTELHLRSFMHRLEESEPAVGEFPTGVSRLRCGASSSSGRVGEDHLDQRSETDLAAVQQRAEGLCGLSFGVYSQRAIVMYWRHHE